MLYNTTTTTTTDVHLVTTSVRLKTSWPLVFTSMTSTSRMGHATGSTSHNHDSLHLQSSMVLHLHSQNGLVNSEPTSTSANLSTSTSWTSPTMRRTLSQQTSWSYRQKQEHVRILRWHVSEQHVKNFEMNVYYLQQNVETSQSSTKRYNNSLTTSTHNKHFRMQQLQQYVGQVNFLVTSLRTRQSPTANQTIYFVDFGEPTSVGKCSDSSGINMPQELVYNNTPCYRT